MIFISVLSGLIDFIDIVMLRSGPSSCCQQNLECLDMPLLLLGRRQANLCFHFAGSGENLPDIAKSRDTSMDNKKQNSFLF